MFITIMLIEKYSINETICKNFLPKAIAQSKVHPKTNYISSHFERRRQRIKLLHSKHKTKKISWRPSPKNPERQDRQGNTCVCAHTCTDYRDIRCDKYK